MYTGQNSKQQICVKFSIVFLWIIFTLACSSQPPPSDQVLIEEFNKNIKNYHSLIKIFELNPTKNYIPTDLLKTENAVALSIPETAIDRYRELCKQLGVNALRRIGLEEIWLIKWDYHPFPLSGTYKGYAVLKEPPGQTVDDLDIYWNQVTQGKMTSSFTVYRHIENEWYLFINYED